MSLKICLSVLYWYREAAISFHDYAPVYISRMYLAWVKARSAITHCRTLGQELLETIKSPEAEDTELLFTRAPQRS